MTEKQRAFLVRVKAAAPVAEGRGVPAAVMVAQAIVESGWGRSGLTRKGNALFGIKATGWPGAVYSGTTREVVAGRSVKFVGKHKLYASRAAALADGCNPVSLFRAYGSFEESILDHTEFFHRNRRYRPALNAYARNKDPFEFAALIAKAGYATALNYADTISKAMRQFAPDLLPGAVAMPTFEKIPAVSVDGKLIPSTAIRIINNRIYLHARLVFEALGYQVHWSKQTRTVTILRNDGG